ncbi:hypothetical protein E2C01_037151 [Portunus trituberculatus]|uniref:Uncharacterized protein n=1 Tax=Portunus trituberculatus TaxID=210409 RepID=A0A5B7FAM1_PORTR|nr:hypothetical protein [Portunus trituberculatus]
MNTLPVHGIVPADGVKGKTWGPSTAHQKERGHIIPHHHDTNQKRWSKSAPNLEKPLRPIPYSTTMMGLNQITAYGPEIGEWRPWRGSGTADALTQHCGGVPVALRCMLWRWCRGGVPAGRGRKVPLTHGFLIACLWQPLLTLLCSSALIHSPMVTWWSPGRSPCVGGVAGPSHTNFGCPTTTRTKVMQPLVTGEPRHFKSSQPPHKAGLEYSNAIPQYVTKSTGSVLQSTPQQPVL